MTMTMVMTLTMTMTMTTIRDDDDDEWWRWRWWQWRWWWRWRWMWVVTATVLCLLLQTNWRYQPSTWRQSVEVIHNESVKVCEGVWTWRGQVGTSIVTHHGGYWDVADSSTTVDVSWGTCEFVSVSVVGRKSEGLNVPNPNPNPDPPIYFWMIGLFLCTLYQALPPVWSLRM